MFCKEITLIPEDKNNIGLNINFAFKVYIIFVGIKFLLFIDYLYTIWWF